MTTVQLAISNKSYAESVRELLLSKGEYAVLIVDRPDPTVAGLIVLEDCLLDSCTPDDPRRFVVITAYQDGERLSWLWRAGFRNVFFALDSPQTAYLAILTAKVRLSGQTRWRCVHASRKSVRNSLTSLSFRLERTKR